MTEAPKQKPKAKAAKPDLQVSLAALEVADAIALTEFAMLLHKNDEDDRLMYFMVGALARFKSIGDKLGLKEEEVQEYRLKIAHDAFEYHKECKIKK